MSDDEFELELLGFYRTRLKECWQTLEALVPHLPEQFRGLVMDHVYKAKSLTARVERLREEQLVPGLDDLADPTAPQGDYVGDEWYDSQGRPCRTGAFDAGGHYHAQRDNSIDFDGELGND